MLKETLHPFRVSQLHNRAFVSEKLCYENIKLSSLMRHDMHSNFQIQLNLTFLSLLEHKYDLHLTLQRFCLHFHSMNLQTAGLSLVTSRSKNGMTLVN